MTQKTYRNMYSFPQLRLEAAKLNEAMATHPIPLQFPILDKSSLFGIEVEVENLEEAPAGGGLFWSVTDDGSLRNFGREYISRPLRGNQVEYALQNLFNCLKDFPYEFTPRCSIHVHCNARTMTPDQLNNMLMVYIIFEKLLFRFIGADRDKNIHCVPITNSSVIEEIVEVVYGLKTPQHGWMKYTALNLVPLSSKGTIEFRHMHGTDNIEKIMTWINIILKMKLYAYKTETDIAKQEIFDLNSNSQYQQFVTRVFGQFTDVLLNNISYEEYSKFMEEGVKTAKRCFSARTYINQLKVVEGTKFSTLFPANRKLFSPATQF